MNATSWAPAEIPHSLSMAAQEFRARMLVLERHLSAGEIGQPEAQASVFEACDTLLGELDRHIADAPAWQEAYGAFLSAECAPLFGLSDVVERAVTKPQGYSGDFYIIEMIYRNTPSGKGVLGPMLDAWCLSKSGACAVRNRRGILTGVLREALAAWNRPDPMPVTSLASGPARELFDLYGADPGAHVHATCVDIDRDALNYAGETARTIGVSDRIMLVQDNVLLLSVGRSKTVIAPQQVIYSMGLIDYLQDKHVVRILDWVYDHLLPGGSTVIGSFGPYNPDRMLMEYVLDWRLIHRSPADLQRLFAQSRFGATPVEVRSDATGVQLIAVAVKNPVRRDMA